MDIGGLSEVTSFQASMHQSLRQAELPPEETSVKVSRETPVMAVKKEERREELQEEAKASSLKTELEKYETPVLDNLAERRGYDGFRLEDKFGTEEDGRFLDIFA